MSLSALRATDGVKTVLSRGLAAAATAVLAAVFSAALCICTAGVSRAEDPLLDSYKFSDVVDDAIDDDPSLGEMDEPLIGSGQEWSEREWRGIEGTGDDEPGKWDDDGPISNPGGDSFEAQCAAGDADACKMHEFLTSTPGEGWEPEGGPTGEAALGTVDEGRADEGMFTRDYLDAFTREQSLRERMLATEQGIRAAEESGDARGVQRLERLHERQREEWEAAKKRINALERGERP